MRASRPTRFEVPRIELTELQSLEHRDPAGLLAAKHHEGALFEAADVSGQDLTGWSFTGCAFEALAADRAKFVGARFVESRIAGLVAPSLSAARTTWRSVEIISSRLGAFEAYEAEFDEVAIEGSKLGWVNLRGSTLRDVLFRNCSIEELDLGGADIRRVSFDDCSVGTLVLQGTRAQHLDLRGLEFSALQGIEGLAGARIGERQAVELLGVFAAHFGVEIAPDR